MSSSDCGRETIQIFEIEQPSCANTYGSSPCTAAVGVSGVRKCFNTLGTCQDLSNYDGSNTIKWRFIPPSSGRIPDYYSNSGGVIGAHAIPSLSSANTSPTKLNVGGGDKKISPFGVRAALRVVINDHQWDDSIGDNYVSERPYDPYTQGTFWGKFIARNKNYSTFVVNIYDGYREEAIGSMTKRTYRLEKIDGPGTTGQVVITAKDPLRIADDKRSLVPPPIEATLYADIDSSQTTGIKITGDGLELNEFHGVVASGANSGRLFCRISDEIISYLEAEDTGVTPPIWAVELQSWWRLEDGSGTTATDEMGNQNATVSTGSAWLTSGGKFGDAVDLDTDDEQSINTNYGASTYFNSTYFTTGGWFKIKALPTINTRRYFFSFPSGGSPRIEWDYNDTIKLIARNTALAVNRILDSGLSPSVDDWIHIAMKRSSTGLYMIINGVEYGPLIGSYSPPTSDSNYLTFGHEFVPTSPNDRSVQAHYDDIFYHDSPLSVSQVKNISEGNLSSQLSVWELKSAIRADLGTTADAHSENDKVSRVARYECPLHTAANDLITEYTGLDAAYIPFSDWATERNAHLTTFDVKGTIAAPISVNKVMGELSEQCMVNWWWDERESEIKMLAIRPIDGTPPEWTDDFHIVKNSATIREDPEQRFSRIFIFWDKRDPTKKDDEEGNWVGVTARIDTNAEIEYSENRTKIIYARWLYSNAQAFQLAVRLLSRYRDNPKYLKLQVDAKDRSTWVGDVVRTQTRVDQDETGETRNGYWQVISAVEKESGHLIEYELQYFELGSQEGYAYYMQSTANDWDNATDAEKAKGAWYTDASGLVPSDNSPGYPMQ